jgi:hypothetical protein
MSCGGCAQRGAAIGRGVSAARRGAWQEAAAAAREVGQSVRVDLSRVAGQVAQAVAAATRRVR